MTDEELADALIENCEAKGAMRALIRVAAGRLRQLSSELVELRASVHEANSPDAKVTAEPARTTRPANELLSLAAAATYVGMTPEAMRIRVQRGQVKPDGRGKRGTYTFHPRTLDAFVCGLAERDAVSASVPLPELEVTRKGASKRRRPRVSGPDEAPNLRVLLKKWQAEEASRKARKPR